MASQADPRGSLIFTATVKSTTRLYLHLRGSFLPFFEDKERAWCRYYQFEKGRIKSLETATAPDMPIEHGWTTSHDLFHKICTTTPVTSSADWCGEILKKVEEEDSTFVSAKPPRRSSVSKDGSV